MPGSPVARSRTVPSGYRRRTAPSENAVHRGARRWCPRGVIGLECEFGLADGERVDGCGGRRGSGPKAAGNPEQTASRHGHDHGSMTLSGGRVPVSRPRIRCAAGREVPATTMGSQADRDPAPAVTRSSERCWTGCSPARRPTRTPGSPSQPPQASRPSRFHTKRPPRDVHQRTRTAANAPRGR